MLLLIVQKNSYYYNLFIIYDDFLEFMNNNVEKCFFGFPKATSDRRGGQICKIFMSNLLLFVIIYDDFLE